ncbi:hypothetical protein HPB49_020785 [Dermacentor silvarum]|uniref:Uncharacterized protein n=1 Tax=Dermacentor silvarum TaxID=543639 RepID=A0ACB8DFM0_DERSI|nr:hypothetical protein HPB49_020785 [Dermacentor silvarum]
MAGGALQAALAAALLLAGCGGRCTAGVGVHDGGGGAPPPSSAALDGDDQRQLKLDAVRHQILSKLSLRERPPQHRESAPPLARELALEALRRVHLLPEPRALEDQGAPDPRQEDDYYGRTAEIIAFAEPARDGRGPCAAGAVRDSLGCPSALLPPVHCDATTAATTTTAGGKKKLFPGSPAGPARVWNLASPHLFYPSPPAP